jgi:cyanophycinase
MKLRALLLCLALAVASTASAHDAPSSRGHLVLIGGAEKPAAAMKKFVELAGGVEALIVVIPTASEEAGTGQYYIDLFAKNLGARNVKVLPIKTKKDARRADYVATAGKAGGIFFAGGDQRRILDALENTPVLEAIRERFRDGAVIGGTSAGTACQSPLMITGEGDFEVIRTGAVELRNGLGFFSGVIVDQHFIARQRFNRLATVVLENPSFVGVGVDEATAVWVRPDETFEVIGKSSVLVLDARKATIHKTRGDGGGEQLGGRALELHILVHGQVFDMKAGTVDSPRRQLEAQ